jgi:xylan 1,4-beta-xylosidase
MTVRDESVRGDKPDINALAAIDEHSATVMVWHYHDDDIDTPAAPVAIEITGLPISQARLHHYRIDKEFSNSYEVWKSMGSPQNPTPEQVETLERAGQLHLLTSPEWVDIKDGKTTVTMQLPRQGVSLLKFIW